MALTDQWIDQFVDLLSSHDVVAAIVVNRYTDATGYHALLADGMVTTLGLVRNDNISPEMTAAVAKVGQPLGLGHATDLVYEFVRCNCTPIEWTDELAKANITLFANAQLVPTVEAKMAERAGRIDRARAAAAAKAAL